ncbi:CMC1 (YKL137W) [Zygosaccharomyces parabailii]|nr:CMC1 (YKL137W) [Zygosaccharomyces parabailii]CDH10212.1 probable COX assembly mitochondrial protein [Zygosaccharomyces bailii ISA1307]
MSEGPNISNHTSRLPIWVLSPREEKEARKNLKQKAYEMCDDYVRAMAECAKANGVRVFPACDQQRDRMSECILFYQVDTKFLDAERDKIVERKISKLEEQVRKSKEGK